MSAPRRKPKFMLPCRFVLPLGIFDFLQCINTCTAPDLVVMQTKENPGAKTMSVVAEPSPSTELRKGALGLGFIIFFVISAAGPLVAIAGGFPIGIMLGNGAGTPALLVATVVILLMFSAGYTAMSRHVTNAGGFYAFTARGLGGTAGGAAALIALLGYNTMQIGLYGMFGAVASGFLSAHFNLNTPWWICSLAAMASIGVFGYRQIDLSAKVLSLLVFGEYIVVLILDLAILKSGGARPRSASCSVSPASLVSKRPRSIAKRRKTRSARCRWRPTFRCC
jgi:amino acid transporter